MMRYLAFAIALAIAPAAPAAAWDRGEFDSALAGLSKTDPTSILILNDGAQLHSLQKDSPAAVGSAFKIAVLVALQREIEAGRAAWDEVLYLTEENRSLPSGLLQVLPAGTPLTLHSLASLMIAFSDNTATDTLIDRIGRQKIERLLGGPMLTTREFFILKLDEKLAEAYRTTRHRPAFLESLAARPLPDVTSDLPLWSADLEWMMSTQSLCNLMERVADLSVFALNPGLAVPEDWKSVAYKGGSEPGVLNLTSWLVAETGEEFCVSVTWNADKPLDEKALFALYGGLLGVLAK